MPELPEVETIKAQLQPILPFKIDDVWLSDKTKRLIKAHEIELKEKTIVAISRQAKWLVFKLEPTGYILSHLGMSGSWQVHHDLLNEKHQHLKLISHQTSPLYLSYIDPRRFGHLYFLSDEGFAKKMASFPLDVSHPDFDENKIAELFMCSPDKKIKPYLLDQGSFPGIGNYMASEICARSGIHPERKVGNISAEEILKIKAAIKLVIQGAVETSGTTFGGGYRDTKGEKGEGVKHLVVFYQEWCQLCKEAGRQTAVTKYFLAGRGTYFCPYCQPPNL